jgi:hypothetical protein
MPDCVHPAINRMQTSPLNPVVDRTPADAGIEQVAPSHDTVLSPRQLTDVRVDQFRPKLTPYSVVNFGMNSHRARGCHLR